MKHRKRGAGPGSSQNLTLLPKPTAPETSDRELDYETAVLTLGEHCPRVLCCTLESDLDSDRSKLFFRKDVSVVVQIKSDGRVAIVFGAQPKEETRTDVLKVLRIREYEKAGRPKEWYDWERKEKRYNWYLFSTARNLCDWAYDKPNGVISSDQTRLSLNEIVASLKLAFNAGQFDLERTNWCRQGVCVSRERDQCPYYRFGLARCMVVRQAMEATAKKPEVSELNEAPEVIFEDATVSQLGFAVDE